MNCTPVTIFAWIATILVNTAFIVLVGWGASQNWVVGFVLSAVYTAVLFILAGCLHRKFSNNIEDKKRAGFGVLIGLLFLLGTISVGVTGLFLPINLLDCDGLTPFSGGSSSINDINGGWVTDTSSFSTEVADWVNQGNTKSTEGNFAYLSNTDTTLFSGWKEGSSTAVLMKVTGGDSQGPQEVSGIGCPSDIVVLADETTACFEATDTEARAQDKGDVFCDVFDYGVVACLDTTDGTLSKVSAINPRELLVDSAEPGRIWFKANPPPSTNEDFSWGNVVYSLNVENMTTTQHSFRSNTQDPTGAGTSAGNSDQKEAGCIRKMSIAILFASPLLVFLAAVAVLVKMDIQSMPLAAYAGLTGIVISLHYIVNPLDPNGAILDVLRWWFTISSALWLLVLTLLSLTNRISKDVKGWSMNFAGLVFFVGSILLFQLFTSTEGILWRWILITLLSFIPLILLGVVTAQFFLVVLGAIGFLFDVWRLAAYITEKAPEGMKVPIQFAFLAFAGLLLALLGVGLNKNMGRVQQGVGRWSEKTLGRFRKEDAEADKSASNDADAGADTAVAVAVL